MDWIKGIQSAIDYTEAHLSPFVSAKAKAAPSGAVFVFVPATAGLFRALLDKRRGWRYNELLQN